MITNASDTREVMVRQLWNGLNAPQKRVDPKYFYDERGSQLFDEITRLPEYYLTRTERALLHSYAPRLIQSHRTRTLVELGAGSGDKTRILLNQLAASNERCTYVPVDISESYLETMVHSLGEQYPTLAIRPCLADVTRTVKLPPDLERPLLIAFLGSTIGNFEPHDAIALLARTGTLLQPDDRFLIGFDLKKDTAVLEAAYNDAAGVTAQFNLNVLNVLNQQLDANFDLQKFRHRAFYNADLGRIEMHLVATEAQEVRIGGEGRIRFEQGESIHTEISCKYDRAQVEHMLNSAGLRVDDWVQDQQAQFALVTAQTV